VAAFISSQRTEHGVPHAVTCRALGVSESWFYKWHGRQPSPRQQRRQELADAIRAVFDASGGTYGSPRVTLDLRAAGWRVSENTVARLMAELGLAGRAPKPRRRSLTRAGKRPVAPDRVRRQFTAVAPDVLWCGDLTEVQTDGGKLYLATVLDLFSRRMLGYAMAEHHDAELAVAALQMAAANRGGTVEGVIFHSDRGSEGEFNRSSQHLDHGGVRWAETRSWSGRPKGYGGSGRRIGRCGRRCVRRVGLSPRALCSGSSGG
jgi:transposase InsO family protein